MDKGKWYKLSNGTLEVDNNWYMEFNEISNDIVKSSRHINIKLLRSNTRVNMEDSFGTPGQYTFTEVPKSEIQEFLPIEERDQINNAYELY